MEMEIFHQVKMDASKLMTTLDVYTSQIIYKMIFNDCLKQIIPSYIDEAGAMCWVDDQHQLHRENKLPAKILANGCRLWYRHGQRHRDGDQPSIIIGHCKIWYQDGQMHREGDQPAYIDDEMQEWWYHGQHHRDGDQPAYISADGQSWFQYSHRHRDGDRPACIWADGTQEWWQHGQHQRTNQRLEKPIPSS